MPAPFGELLVRRAGPLAAGLVVVLAAAALTVYPPAELVAGEVPSWLPPALGMSAASGLALASVAWIAVAVRSGSSQDLALAAGCASLAGGLIVMAATAFGDAAGLPDHRFAPAAVVGSLAIGAAAALPDRPSGGLRRGLVGLLLVFAVVEGSVAAALLLGDALGSASARLLAVAGAILVAAAMTTRPPAWGLSLLAGALLALAIARGGTLDVAPGLAGMALGGILLAARSSLGERSGVSAEPPTTAPTPLLLPQAAPAPPVADTDDAATLGEPQADQRRLARELRGTIEELMQTRRTVELQRTELERAASVDSLTGVASRRAILERLSTEAAEARRYTHPLAMLLIDVDAFTAMNHEHGLSVGDAVLRELALRLRLRIRTADALGRHGADSFLAILPHTDERGAAIFADAVRKRLTSRPVLSEAGELSVTVSIGVAFMRPGMDIGDEELLAAADEALASARAAGGNRIAFDRLHGLARLEESRSRRPGA